MAHARQKAIRETARDQFAVSEQEFLERLNVEDSSTSRLRLEHSQPAAGAYPWARFFEPLRNYVTREPQMALLATFAAGLAVGFFMKRQ